jgi:hypothetical protein
MRYLLTLFPIVLIACWQPGNSKQHDPGMTGYWISKNLEPYSVDSAFGGGKTIYGAGYLLKLDTNGQAVSLGADFYWKDDSLYKGGEPGMTLKIGNWHKEENILLLNQRLASRTFMRTGDRIGQIETDSVNVFVGRNLIHGQDTLISVKKLSIDLKEFVETLVTFHKENVGS